MNDNRIFRSPSTYIQGESLLSSICKYASAYGNNALFIIPYYSKDHIADIIKYSGINLNSDTFSYEIFVLHDTYTDSDIRDIVAKYPEIDVVIGIGGNYNLGLAKSISFYRYIPLIVAPTSASAYYACSRFANVYDDNGSECNHLIMKSNPELVLVDTSFIITGGPKLLACGISDALSLCYQTEYNYKSCQNHSIVQFAVCESCKKIIFDWSLCAYQDAERNYVSKAIENILEANILLSGILAEQSTNSIANIICDLLYTNPASSMLLHGERMAFSLITQMCLLDEKPATIKMLVNFFTNINMPVTFSELGINTSDIISIRDGYTNKCVNVINDIAQIAVSCSKSKQFLEYIGRPTNVKNIYKAFIHADEYGQNNHLYLN